MNFAQAEYGKKRQLNTPKNNKHQGQLQLFMSLTPKMNNG